MLQGVAELPYITCGELAELIANSSSKVAVIDVRDEDFVGGHIKGAINSPSEDLEDDDELEALIERVCVGGESKSEVVFHCMKSQERGPTCARRFKNRLSSYDLQNVPCVYILQGGFEAFAAAYSQDSSLCDDVDPTMWK
jgi:Cdc25 family phosphatase